MSSIVSRLKWMIIGLQLIAILALLEWVLILQRERDDFATLSERMHDRAMEILDKPDHSRRVARDIVMMWMEKNGRMEERS